MKNLKTFENFKKFENIESIDISSLYKFANKPLLGGYILDIFVNNIASIGIKISDQPDTKQGPFVGVGTHTGKKTSDFEIIETIIYWLEDETWQLGKLVYKKKTQQDEELLKEIANTIKSK